MVHHGGGGRQARPATGGAAEETAMKDWSQRLDAGSAQVKRAPRRFGDIPEGAMMLVPTARQVDDFLRTIPVGKQMSVRELRSALAGTHGADGTCPWTTGYHLRTVAEAAHETLERGAPIEQATPFWRVLDGQTPTTGKLSFGVGFVTAQRKREGLEG
jgi:hypothetical protein